MRWWHSIVNLRWDRRGKKIHYIVFFLVQQEFLITSHVPLWRWAQADCIFKGCWGLTNKCKAMQFFKSHKKRNICALMPLRMQQCCCDKARFRFMFRPSVLTFPLFQCFWEIANNSVPTSLTHGWFVAGLSVTTKVLYPVSQSVL